MKFYTVFYSRDHLEAKGDEVHHLHPLAEDQRLQSPTDLVEVMSLYLEKIPRKINELTPFFRCRTASPRRKTRWTSITSSTHSIVSISLFMSPHSFGLL